MGFIYKSVLTVGIQILCSLLGGWTTAHFKGLDPEVYTPKINQFAIKVLCPCLGVWVLGIKTGMRDAETWKVIGVFVLWNTVIQLLCALYVRLRERRFIAGYALYSTALAYNNTGIIGPVMSEAVLGPDMVSLGMLISIPMFISQVALLLVCFEAHKLHEQEAGTTIDPTAPHKPPPPLPVTAPPTPSDPPAKPDPKVLGSKPHPLHPTFSQDLPDCDSQLRITCSVASEHGPPALYPTPSSSIADIQQGHHHSDHLPDCDGQQGHSDHHPPSPHSPHMYCKLTPQPSPLAPKKPSAHETHKTHTHPAAGANDAESSSSSASRAEGAQKRGGGGLRGPWRVMVWVGEHAKHVLPPRALQLINIIFMNPLMLSMFLGIFMSLAGLNEYLDPDRPKFVWQLGFIEGTLRWFARATAPLTMFAQGLWLHGKVRPASFNLRSTSKISLFVILRLTVMPVSMAAVAKLCGLEDRYSVGLMVMTAIPVGQLAFVFAEQYGIGTGFVTALMIVHTFTMLPHVIALLEVVQRFQLFHWSPPAN